MPVAFELPSERSEARASAAVRRLVELLLEHGYTYAQIAREANGCLTDKDRSEVEKRSRVSKLEREPLTAPAIRVFVERQKKREEGRKPPGGLTFYILYIYLNREKRRFPSFIAEYMTLILDGFLDPNIVPDEALEGDPRKAFEDFLVASTYRLISRMMGVDYLAVRKSAKELEGEYLCVRPSYRDKDNLVVSRLVIQPRANVEEIWEYRHTITTDTNDIREADGMVLVVNHHFIMLGDVAHGHGLEMLVVNRPGLAQPNVLAGVTSTLNLGGNPIVGQFALFKSKPGSASLLGVINRQDCESDLRDSTVAGKKVNLAVILKAIGSQSIGLPTFNAGLRQT